MTRWEDNTHFEQTSPRVYLSGLEKLNGKRCTQARLAAQVPVLVVAEEIIE